MKDFNLTLVRVVVGATQHQFAYDKQMNLVFFVGEVYKVYKTPEGFPYLHSPETMGERILADALSEYQYGHSEVVAFATPFMAVE